MYKRTNWMQLNNLNDATLAYVDFNFLYLMFALMNYSRLDVIIELSVLQFLIYIFTIICNKSIIL